MMELLSTVCKVRQVQDTLGLFWDRGMGDSGEEKVAWALGLVVQSH